MAQDIRYNYDFSDEDAKMLVQIAQGVKDPQQRFFPCRWKTGEAVCCHLVQGPDFPDHLRSHHGIAGSEKAQVMCCWSDCSTEMRRESLIRHVNEKHLEFKYPCPSCSEQFTRPYTMQNHISKKHTGS